MFDLLVLNYNDYSTTKQFVKSVEKYSCVNKILIVDNFSTDASYEKLLTMANEKILVLQTKKNGGYGFGNNFGINYLYQNFKSEYILLCNPDVFIEERSCKELEKFLRENQEYSIVAPFMKDVKGCKQKNTAFKILSKWKYICSLELFFKKYFSSFFYEHIECEEEGVPIDVDAVSGSLFMMRVADMLKYGMYDENNFLYCEELILGLKLRKAKKRTALLTNISFIHNHSVSISKTYKSEISKHRLFLKSKLYVIKHYYYANKIEILLAYILAKISFVETFLLEIKKKVKKNEI